MTYTVVNPHACCNWSCPENVNPHACCNWSCPPARHRTPTHRQTSPTTTDWKTDGRPPANGSPTTAPQQRRHSPTTPARGPPKTPLLPDPAHSHRHHPSKAKVRSPLRNRIFSLSLSLWKHARSNGRSKQEPKREEVCLFKAFSHSLRNTYNRVSFDTC